MRLIAAKLIVLGILVMCVGCTSGFRTFKLPTDGMSPTLVKGDWFIATPTKELQRGDIIVFKYPKDTSIWYVFRVIGLPNETVEIKDNKVLIDGLPLEEGYVMPTNNVAKSNQSVYQVPAECYFVMGDNRDNSADSRFWGTVPRDLIYGTFYMKYFHSDPKKEKQ